MPRLAICSRDLHWQWINWAPLYDTMEVSMLRLTWLTVAQHVFQPALTGRLELISRKIVSCEPGTKAIAVSRFREKLSPANWVQGVTAISRKISRSWAPKMGSNMRPRYIQFRDIRDRDISGLHCTWPNVDRDLDGILPKGPYPPCLRMADRALLAICPRSMLPYSITRL